MFGHYRIEGTLGGGRTGEVHRAFDTRTERTVALKRLRTDLEDPEGLVERFRRETRVVAGLSSPHLVPIHEVGEIDGRLYIDMRLVRGRDLATVLLDSGPLPPRRVAAVVEQVGAALHTAHEEGLVHRDVKPANVLLDERDEDEHAYLVDFGIATTTVPHPDAAVRSTAGGSPAYIPPEMFYDVAVDRRTDVYALACLTFELLTGRPPFGVHGSAAMADHLTVDPPRLSHARPGLNAGLDDVLARGMAKRPDERHPTAPAFASAVREVLDPRPEPVPEPEPDDAVPPEATGPARGAGWWHRHRTPATVIAVIAAFVALVAVLFGVFGAGGGASTEPTTSAVTGPVGTGTTGRGGNDPASLAALRAVFPQAGGAGCDEVDTARGRYEPLASVGCSAPQATVYYEVWPQPPAALDNLEAYRRLEAESTAQQWYIAGSDVPQGPVTAVRSGNDHIVVALYADRRYSISVVAATAQAAVEAFRSVGARPVEQVPR